MLSTKKPTRTCKATECRGRFTPRTPTQIVCSVECSIKYSTERARKSRERKAAEKLRDDRERIKTLSQVAGEAQKAVNAFVRERDHGLPCISCHRYHQGQYHAGHYRTTKAAPQLRFNLWNIHRQCSACNTHLSGNITEFRISLINRIGPDRVIMLENTNHVAKYDREYLKRLKRIFAKRARLYRKHRQSNPDRFAARQKGRLRHEHPDQGVRAG